MVETEYQHSDHSNDPILDQFVPAPTPPSHQSSRNGSLDHTQQVSGDNVSYSNVLSQEDWQCVRTGSANGVGDNLFEKVSSADVVDHKSFVGASGTTYTVYVVEVTTEHDELGWRIHREFNDFFTMHNRLLACFPANTLPVLPTRWNGQGIPSPDDFAAYRCKALDAYVKDLLSDTRCRDHYLFREFFEDIQNNTAMRDEIRILKEENDRLVKREAELEDKLAALSAQHNLLETSEEAANRKLTEALEQVSSLETARDSEDISKRSILLDSDPLEQSFRHGILENSTTGDDSAVSRYVNMIVRPPRFRYPLRALGKKKFYVLKNPCVRSDFATRNPRGQVLQCSLFRLESCTPDNKRPCVIYCHGNCGSRVDTWPHVVFSLLSYGISLVTFDFSGCGLSEGESLSLGFHECEDLRAVVKRVRESGVASSIGVWGRSMGAVATLMYAKTDQELSGIVVDSPFTNLKAMMTETARQKMPRVLAKLGIGMLGRAIEKKAGFKVSEVDAIGRAPSCTVPILIAHGKEDTLIPPSHSKELFNKYGGPKHCLLFKGRHNSQRPDYFMDLCGMFFNFSLIHHNSAVFYEVMTESRQSIGQISACIRSSEYQYEVTRVGGVVALTPMKQGRGSSVSSVPEMQRHTSANTSRAEYSDA